MNALRGFFILAACLAVTMAAPVENKALQAVAGGINQFSSAFFGEVSKGQSGNLITSPLSASVALSMAGYGARGETEKEFKQVLHLPEESVARTGYPNLFDSINGVKNVELRLANKVFVNEKFSVKPSFQELTQSAFRSASEKVNFANAQAAVNTINKWCEDQTNNRIKDLLTPDKVSGDTAMVLVNAVYFKGKWAHQFKPKETENKPFHVSKTQVKNVPTMHRLGSYRYGVLPELKAKFVEIPYKGEEMSMIVILPDEVDGLAALERKLAHKDLTEIVKKGFATEVSLSLPKFKIESSLDLGENLKTIGLKKAFDPIHADFSGISNTGVYISSVVQKAFIEVNEEGSEAAAATGLVFHTLSLVIPEEFTVDRPFYYSIQMKVSADQNGQEGYISLFSGHVMNP